MDTGLANVIIAALATALVAALLTGRANSKVSTTLSAMSVVAANQNTQIAGLQETLRLLTSIQGEHTAEIRVLQSEQKSTRMDVHDFRNKLTEAFMERKVENG